MLEKLTKGDSELLDCDIDTDITNWKIRCQIFDESNNLIKLATSNSGGSTDQIEVVDATEGKFQIKIVAGATKDFNDKAKIEIEVETTNTIGGSPEVKTIYQGDILFKKQAITWETPS